MNNDLISVIIPAYNVESYIKKCLDSVLHQTHENLEIIIVNDGSTDNTGKISDEIASQDNRVIVVHQSNSGLSMARNIGLEAANGSWVAFLDSDDWIEPEMYEILYQIATKHCADIASCKSRNVFAGKEYRAANDDGCIIELSPDQIISGLYDQKIVRFEVWNKLWKRELIGNTRFKRGQVCEDVYFDRILFLRANKMVHINKTLHNYLISRPGNTNSSFKPAKIGVLDEFKSFIIDLDEKDKSILADIISCIGIGFSIDLYLNATRSKQTEEYIQEVKNYYYYFRKRAILCEQANKKAIRLFDFSPRLYRLYLKFKERQLNSK